MGFIWMILGVIHAIRELTRPKDYSIKDIRLEYVVESIGYAVVGKLWEDEKKKWDTLPDIFSVSVKNKTFLPLPEFIKSPILKIVYFFNNREYVYVTSSMEYDWPPKKVTSMSFVLPIKNAVLLNADDAPVKNITKQFNEYAGPRCDYHGAPVPLTDMIDKPFSKLRVTNIMNQQSVLNLGS